MHLRVAGAVRIGECFSNGNMLCWWQMTGFGQFRSFEDYEKGDMGRGHNLQEIVEQPWCVMHTTYS